MEQAPHSKEDKVNHAKWTDARSRKSEART